MCWGLLLVQLIRFLLIKIATMRYCMMISMNPFAMAFCGVGGRQRQTLAVAQVLESENIVLFNKWCTTCTRT